MKERASNNYARKTEVNCAQQVWSSLVYLFPVLIPSNPHRVPWSGGVENEPQGHVQIRGKVEAGNWVCCAHFKVLSTDIHPKGGIRCEPFGLLSDLSHGCSSASPGGDF